MGAQLPGAESMGAPNHCGGRRKVPTMTQVPSPITHLLAKDLRFEHGSA